MGTLVVANCIVWAAVSAYLGWLAVQNGRLSRRLEELEAVVGDHGSEHDLPSKAA